jgi:hypothetical protein
MKCPVQISNRACTCLFKVLMAFLLKHIPAPGNCWRCPTSSCPYQHYGQPRVSSWGQHHNTKPHKWTRFWAIYLSTIHFLRCALTLFTSLSRSSKWMFSTGFCQQKVKLCFQTKDAGVVLEQRTFTAQHPLWSSTRYLHCLHTQS